MKKEPNKKLIGLFMIFGLAMLTGLIVKNAVEQYMVNNRNLVVLYFAESISGLNIGSPVVYEGVQVGKVVKIEIQTNPKTMEFSIPVYIRFSQDKDFSHMSFAENVTRREYLELLIKKGLRARLESQNLLTGQLMIELFMDEKAPIIYHVDKTESKQLELPTTLSAIGNLARDIGDLPLKQIIWRFDNVLSKLESDLPPLFETYGAVGNKLNNYIDKSTMQTNQTLNQLNRTLKDVSNASQSMKNLTDYLERHPDSILKGKKE